MSKFNRTAAVAARVANPALTLFDTGELLEPHPHTGQDAKGEVDFDDSESCTVFTISAYPSSVFEDTVVLEIDSALFTRLKIMVNDGHVATINTDGSMASVE